MDEGVKWVAVPVGRIEIDQSRRRFIEGQELHGVDFSGPEVNSFTSVGSRFVDCHFDDMKLENAAFGSGFAMSEYVNCTFARSRFGIGPGRARFINCSFDETRIKNWTVSTAKSEFIDCTFTGTLRTMIFWGRPDADDVDTLGRTRNRFEGNDFSRATLSDVSFRAGIDLTKQVLPTGPDYFIITSPTQMRSLLIAVEQWPEVDERRDIRSTLEIYQGTFDTGQEQILNHPKTFRRDGGPLQRFLAQHIGPPAGP